MKAAHRERGCGERGHEAQPSRPTIHSSYSFTTRCAHTRTPNPPHTPAHPRTHKQTLARTRTHTLTHTHSHTRSPDRNLGVREKRVGESREMPSEATAETIAPKEHRSDSTLALSTPRVNIKIQVTRSESPNGEVQIRSTGAFNREILYCLQSIRRTSR